MAGRQFLDEARPPAKVRDRQYGYREAHRHEDQHLDEVPRDHRPAPAEQGDREHQCAERNHREGQVEAEDRREKHRDRIEVQRRLQCAERELEPGKHLLVGPRESQPHRLDAGDHPHLPKLRREVPRVDQETEGIGDVDDHDRPPVAISLARRARERPGAERHHEGRSAHHPPQGLAPAPKVVGHIGHEPPEHAADRDHEAKIEHEDGVVVLGHRGRRARGGGDGRKR